MIDGTASVSAQDSRGVGIVDHHDGSVLFGELTQVGQRTDIAVHGKDAVGDQQLLSRLIFNTGQSFFSLRHVFMLEDQNLGARQTGAIDDGSVVQLVGNDEIVLAEDGRDRAGVGGESRLKDYAGFDVLEARNFFFKLDVDLHGAGNGAHCAGTHSVFASGLKRSL